MPLPTSLQLQGGLPLAPPPPPSELKLPHDEDHKILVIKAYNVYSGKDKETHSQHILLRGNWQEVYQNPWSRKIE